MPIPAQQLPDRPRPHGIGRDVWASSQQAEAHQRLREAEVGQQIERLDRRRGTRSAPPNTRSSCTAACRWPPRSTPAPAASAAASPGASPRRCRAGGRSSAAGRPRLRRDEVERGAVEQDHRHARARRAPAPAAGAARRAAARGADSPAPAELRAAPRATATSGQPEHRREDRHGCLESPLQQATRHANTAGTRRDDDRAVRHADAASGSSTGRKPYRFSHVTTALSRRPRACQNHASSRRLIHPGDRTSTASNWRKHDEP